MKTTSIILIIELIILFILILSVIYVWNRYKIYIQQLIEENEIQIIQKEE
jgi:hypothetical protein